MGFNSGFKVLIISRIEYKEGNLNSVYLSPTCRRRRVESRKDQSVRGWQ